MNVLQYCRTLSHDSLLFHLHADVIVQIMQTTLPCLFLNTNLYLQLYDNDFKHCADISRVCVVFITANGSLVTLSNDNAVTFYCRLVKSVG